MSEANNNSIIKSEVLSYFKKKQKVRINLHDNCVKVYHIEKEEQQIDFSKKVPDLALNLDDIAGVSSAKGHTQDDTNAYLTIYAYLRIKNGKLRRKRFSFEFAYSKQKKFEDNLAKVYELESCLNNLLNERLTKRSLKNNSNDSNNNNNSISINVKSHKPFLVFVNPKAGAGRAKSIYYERVLPVWAESSTKNVLVLTRNFYFQLKSYLKLRNS